MAGSNDRVNGIDIGDAGDALETAASVGHSSQISGSAGFSPDTGDYYRFVPNEDGLWTATLDGLGADLDLNLLDSNGQALAISNATGTNPDYVTFDVTAFEVYYLHVIPDGSVSSDYNLRMQLVGERPVVVGTAGDDVCDLVPFVGGSARGGPGNDLYIVDDALDRAIENAGEGTDTVEASLSWELADHLENLRLVGSNATEGIGNALDNQILGNVDYNRLSGGAGNDTLDGATGVDTMDGGLGDDVYYVDTANDVVTEQSNEVQAAAARSAAIFPRAWRSADGRDPPEGSSGTGSNIDTVISQVSYTLRTNIENLQLADDGAVLDLNGTGNDLDNLLTGNSGNNALSALGGRDILDGGNGDDTLEGGDGADTLGGGQGDDVYLVGTGDALVEVAGGGTDIVQSAVSWKLAANIEKLELTGSSAVNATGNASSNTLSGNGAANRLDGGAGSDTLIGGAGNDVYIVGRGDRITEAGGGGTDSVQSAVSWTLATNVEKLLLSGSGAINGAGNGSANSLTGNAAANTLSGAGGADTITGLAGNDVLKGGTGNDTLSGGSGADIFVFDTALNASTNKDRITDFTHASDKLRLDDDVFKGLAVGALGVTQFRSGAGVTTAADANDRIVYNTSTGALYYDSDGSGPAAAVGFAVVGSSTHPALSAADFVVVG